MVAGHVPGSKVRTDAEIRERVCQWAKTDYRPIGSCKIGDYESVVVDQEQCVHELWSRPQLAIRAPTALGVTARDGHAPGARFPMIAETTLADSGCVADVAGQQSKDGLPVGLFDGQANPLGSWMMPGMAGRAV